MPEATHIGDGDGRPRRSAADLFDGAAMLCSGACVTHCLVPPALLLLLPALTLGAAGSEPAHGWLLAFAIGAAVPALALGYRRHRNAATILVAAAGLALLAGGAIFGEAVETVLTVSGSAAILAAHRRNLRLRRRCPALGR